LEGYAVKPEFGLVCGPLSLGRSGPEAATAQRVEETVPDSAPLGDQRETASNVVAEKVVAAG